MESTRSRSAPGTLRFAFGLAAAAALALSAAAQAADGPPRGTTAGKGQGVSRVEVRVVSIPLQEECPADDNEAMNAMKAFIDPTTGVLRAPTHEEEAALARAIAGKARIHAQAQREVQVGANGAVTYFLGEDGMEDIVVRTGSDGKAVFFCTPRSETPKALTHPLPAPKKNEAAKEEK